MGRTAFHRRWNTTATAGSVGLTKDACVAIAAAICVFSTATGIQKKCDLKNSVRAALHLQPSHDPKRAFAFVFDPNSIGVYSIESRRQAAEFLFEIARAPGRSFGHNDVKSHSRDTANSIYTFACVGVLCDQVDIETVDIAQHLYAYSVHPLTVWPATMAARRTSVDFPGTDKAGEHVFAWCGPVESELYVFTQQRILIHRKPDRQEFGYIRALAVDQLHNIAYFSQSQRYNDYIVIYSFNLATHALASFRTPAKQDFKAHASCIDSSGHLIPVKDEITVVAVDLKEQRQLFARTFAQPLWAGQIHPLRGLPTSAEYAKRVAPALLVDSDGNLLVFGANAAVANGYLVDVMKLN